jgi:hypothetical protein
MLLKDNTNTTGNYSRKVGMYIDNNNNCYVANNPVNWNGNTFTALIDYKLGDAEYKGTVSGVISNNGNEVVSVSCKLDVIGENSNTEKFLFEGKNVPLVYKGDYGSWACGEYFDDLYNHTYKVEGPQVKNHVASFTYSRIDYFSSGEIMTSESSISADYDNVEDSPELTVSFTSRK